MEHLIDKDAVLAEIRKLHDKHISPNYVDEAGVVLEELEDAICFLEVKEVDLEKETKKWWKERLHLKPENQLWMDAHQSIVFAKHFFELGLKAQKGK